jgi:hypothetical protein
MSNRRLEIATLHDSVRAASVRTQAGERNIRSGHQDDLRLLMFHGRKSRIFRETDPLITTLGHLRNEVSDLRLVSADYPSRFRVTQITKM